MAETVTRPGIRRLAWGLRFEVDRHESAGSVTATFAGLVRVKAIHRPGLGCVLPHSGNPTPIDLAPAAAATATKLLPAIAGANIVEPVSEGLRAALASAFEEPPKPPLRRTKAVVVVRDGSIIAERYAPGIGPDMPLMGFSLAKSIINALLGILTRDGRLSPSELAPIAEWQGGDDPRRKITIEHLMRMTSGLAADETNSGFDASSRILYLEADMGRAAAHLPQLATPGTRWHYSSPSTVLLSRIIARTVGGGPADVLAFAQERLFSPLGMGTAVMEADTAGGLVGSTYVFASPRDWARFGLLYLNDGKIGDTRLLPEGWVDFSASSSLETYYGAGFWTVRSEHPWARQWRDAGLPADTFFALGDLGQRIVIMPSKRLLVVRLGDAVDPTGDMGGLLKLVRDIIAVGDAG
jgi:CubicO group peptidase (beta-lactamase class C family)